MQQLNLDAPAWLLPFLAIIAFIAARYLYSAKQSWSKSTNILLLTLRAIFIFLLLFLLLGPVLKLITHTTQNPVVVVIEDKSASVLGSSDSAQSKSTLQEVEQLSASLKARGYDIVKTEIETKASRTNLSLSINNALIQNEGRKISYLLLASDGIFNAGVSPLYKDYPFQIFTIGLGDSSVRRDLTIKNLVYNKIAYQGNRFPLIAEISTHGFANETIVVSVYKQGKKLTEKSLLVNTSGIAIADFILTADKSGLQKYEITITSKNDEWNKNNNTRIAYIDVVEGKKKVVLLAAAPHPDIKAIRAALEKNDNYTVSLHISGIGNNIPEKDIAEADLIMLHQLPNVKVKNNLVTLANTNKAALLFLFGEQTDWQEVNKLGFLTLESLPRQKDEVLTYVNPDFTLWQYSQELVTSTRNWPPLTVPFVKFTIPPTASPLCYQQIGSVSTTKPVLWLDQNKEKKQAFMLGEGFWRWRLHEYNQTEQHAVNNEYWSKLIQFLTTDEDKVRFRCFPIEKEISLNQEVVFEAQVYNPLYEPIYGQQINLQITNEQSVRTNYQFTTTQANSRFVVGNLPEGIYTYSANVMLEKQIKVTGEFVVTNTGIELTNTQADFNLLRSLAAKTNGKFYLPSQLNDLKKETETWQPNGILQSEENYEPLVNLALFFVLLVILISSEWFLRKYNGSY